MASVAGVISAISKVTGVHQHVVENVARRLGEAEMLPRGPRGRHAPEFEPVHVSRVLLGVMAVSTEALDTPAARSAKAVERIGALELGGEAAINIFENDDGEIFEVPTGSFTEHLAVLIEHKWYPTSVADVGITFSGSIVRGWIEQEVVESRSQFGVNKQRLWFGPHEVEPAGMTREVRISRAALDRLAELVTDGIVEALDEAVESAVA